MKSSRHVSRIKFRIDLLIQIGRHGEAIIGKHVVHEVIQARVQDKVPACSGRNLYDHLFREKVYSFLHLDKPPIFVIIKLSGRNIAYFFIYSLF
nr:MAG TPA: hypothetical protein [Caudoviricetes sp.]